MQSVVMHSNMQQNNTHYLTTSCKVLEAITTAKFLKTTKKIVENKTVVTFTILNYYNLHNLLLFSGNWRIM